MGVTPTEYIEAFKVRKLKGALRESEDVTAAVYDAGFGSSSRVYERADTRLGMTPMQYRRGGQGVSITYATAESDAGKLMIGATDRGICFVQFGESEEELRPLILDTTRSDPPSMTTVVVQLLVALGAIVGGAHIFVEQILHIADSAGLEPLVLSLVLAPFATELPEKANSFFWVRDGKDSLALGNITGAMVFQSTLPVSIGLAFTPWELDSYSIVAGALALAGGLVAIVTLQIRRRFSGRAIALWAGLYAAFVVYVVVAA